jgi:putative copper resistance protein D
MAADVASALVRTLLLVAMLQAAGASVYLALFGPQIGSARAPIARLGLAASVLAVVALGSFLTLEAARMAGEFAGLLDPELLALALGANAWPAATRLAGLLLLIAAFVSGRALPIGVVGALLVATSFALTGHSVDAEPRVPAGALVALHVLLGAVWFGSLLPLRWASRLEAPADAARLVEGFSLLATWSVPLIAVAGITLAWLLGVRTETLQQPYGALLLLKATAFVALMVLAAANKWRYGPRLATADPAAARGLQRATGAEYVLIVGVLGATAVLTTWFVPFD